MRVPSFTLDEAKILNVLSTKEDLSDALQYYAGQFDAHQSILAATRAYLPRAVQERLMRHMATYWNLYQHAVTAWML